MTPSADDYRESPARPSLRSRRRRHRARRRGPSLVSRLGDRHAAVGRAPSRRRSCSARGDRRRGPARSASRHGEQRRRCRNAWPSSTQSMGPAQARAVETAARRRQREHAHERRRASAKTRTSDASDRNGTAASRARRAEKDPPGREPRSRTSIQTGASARAPPPASVADPASSDRVGRRIRAASDPSQTGTERSARATRQQRADDRRRRSEPSSSASRGPAQERPARARDGTARRQRHRDGTPRQRPAKVGSRSARRPPPEPTRRARPGRWRSMFGPARSSRRRTTARAARTAAISAPSGGRRPRRRRQGSGTIDCSTPAGVRGGVRDEPSVRAIGEARPMLRAADRAAPLASVHPAAGLARRGRRSIIERGRGHRPDRHRRPPLPRRRLVAVVQRPRPPPPGDRRRDPRPARPRRPHDDARPHPPSRRSSWRERLVAIAPAGPDARLLLRRRRDRGRDRAEDGVPVLAQQRGDDAQRTSSSRSREAYHGDTIGAVSVGGIDLFHATYRPLLFEHAHRAAAGRRRRTCERAARRAHARRDRGA